MFKKVLFETVMQNVDINATLDMSAVSVFKLTDNTIITDLNCMYLYLFKLKFK